MVVVDSIETKYCFVMMEFIRLIMMFVLEFIRLIMVFVLFQVGHVCAVFDSGSSFNRSITG